MKKRIWLSLALAGAMLGTGLSSAAALAGERSAEDKARAPEGKAQVTSREGTGRVDLEALAAQASISAQQAINIAKTRVASRLKKVELRPSGDRPVYEVKFSSGELVKVDASSGAILEVRKPRSHRHEDDHDEDDD